MCLHWGGGAHGGKKQKKRIRFALKAEYQKKNFSRGGKKGKSGNRNRGA